MSFPNLVEHSMPPVRELKPFARAGSLLVSGHSSDRKD